ncbi:MAG TPA: hypothetical protein VGB92_14535 [Longimicrobium sp.]|jgi:hypothetical protein
MSNNNHAETGGPSLVQSIADRQRGPTCGFEAVENVVLLFHPARNDLLETHLVPLAARDGTLVPDPEGFRLNTRGYTALLTRLGVAATWHAFDHQTLVAALQENRVAIAVVDAHKLAPAFYPNPRSWHAIVVTNYVSDPQHVSLLGYVGIDSNFPGEERWWNADDLTLPQGFSFFSLLITDSPARWPSSAHHYVLRADGEVVPA